MSEYEVKKNMLGTYVVHYSCVTCGAALNSPLDEAGVADTCPECSHHFTVPGEKELSAIRNAEIERTQKAEIERNRRAQIERERKIQAKLEKKKQAEIARQQAEALREQEEKIKKAMTERWEATSKQPMTFVQANIVIGLLAIGLGVPVFSWLRPTPKWEYQIVSPGDESLTGSLDVLGDKGWELVFARRALSSTGSDPAYELIFKRPK